MDDSGWGVWMSINGSWADMNSSQYEHVAAFKGLSIILGYKKETAFEKMKEKSRTDVRCISTDGEIVAVSFVR